MRKCSRNVLSITLAAALLVSSVPFQGTETANAATTNLTSIVDSSVNKATKFTHEEWKGTTYNDVDGNEVKGAEVYAINRKDASATSTAYVSYDSVENAIIGARDYNKSISPYVQYLTGKEDEVKDWSLVVVQNQTVSDQTMYADFYETDYPLQGDWKTDLALTASITDLIFLYMPMWLCHGSQNMIIMFSLQRQRLSIILSDYTERISR